MIRSRTRGSDIGASTASSEAYKEVHDTGLPLSTMTPNSALNSVGTSSLNFNMESHELKLYLFRIPYWLAILIWSPPGCVDLPPKDVQLFGVFGPQGRSLVPLPLSLSHSL